MALKVRRGCSTSEQALRHFYEQISILIAFLGILTCVCAPAFSVFCFVSRRPQFMFAVQIAGNVILMLLITLITG